MDTKNRYSALRITLTGLFMALTIVFASFYIPVPGGHLYLCDMVISLAAILLNPFEAFAVGGIGSYLGDLIFYPAPRYVSLVTHGTQAVVISVFVHYVMKNRPKAAAGIGVTFGAVIMVVGYTLGKTFVYSNFETAMIKLPFEILQGAVGAVLGWILCFKCGIRKVFIRTLEEEA